MSLEFFAAINAQVGEINKLDWSDMDRSEQDLPPNYNFFPWVPMTNARDAKTVGKLGEESGELATVCCRAYIQGMDGINPETGKTNRVWLEDEIADVRANSEIAIERFGLDEERIKMRAARKKRLLVLWHAALGE